MQKTILLILGLGILALAAFLLGGNEETATRTDPPPASTQQVEAPPPLAQEAAAAPLPIQEMQREEQGLGKRNPEQDSATSETRPVRIVDAETREPIAGAEVWALDRKILDTTDPSTRAVLDQWQDPEERGRRLTRALLSDSDGFVHIPITENGSILTARADSRFGFDQHFYEMKMVLKLHADRETSVRVLDHRGSPLEDVWVGLVYQNDSYSGCLPESAVRTDANGIAKVRHLQVWAGDGRPDIRISPHVLTKEDLSLSLEEWERGDHGDTIVLPPLGSLRVEVRDYHGEPIDGSMGLFLLLDPDPGSRPEEHEISPRRQERFPLEIRGMQRQHRFPHVGLDLDLAALAYGTQAPIAPVGFGRGPWQEGQEVHLVLKPPTEAIVYRMRLVDREGTPVANRPATVSATDKDGNGHSYSTQSTTDDGVLELELDRSDAAALMEDVRGFQVLARGDGSTPSMGADLPIPEEPYRSQDFGDVIVSTEGILIAGRLLDDEGAPIEGAWVSVTAEGGKGEEDLWELLVTRQDGGFALFSTNTPGPVKVSTAVEGFLKKEVEVPAGTQDLVIRLERGLTVKGSLVLPPSANPTNFGVDFLDPQGEILLRARCKDDGSFELASLKDMPGQLSILHKNQGTEFLRLMDIQPVPEDQPQDPRLASIDLRDLIRHATLKVQRGDLKPVPRAVLRGREDGFIRSAFGNAEGEVELFLGPSPVRARVTAAGFLPAVVDIQEGEQIVTLEGGLAARLRLPPELEIPDGYHLRIRGHLLGEEGETLGFTDWASFGLDGLAIVEIPSTGRYTALLSLQGPKDRIQPLPSWESLGQSFLDITMEGDLAVGLVEVSQEEIQRLID